MNKIFPILAVLFFISCGNRNAETNGKINVVVSILPQKYFVEKIGGARVNVAVMVERGQSPETYEPTPAQMTDVHNAKILFILGVPFEDAWVSRVGSLNKDLAIIDVSSGIERREMENPALILGDNNMKHEHNHGMKDPHMWLDPLYVKKMALSIFDALVKADPTGIDEYKKGRDRFIKELSDLDEKIRGILKPRNDGMLFVFHPAWGYFTDRYGLKQFPVEIEGREPGPREMVRIMDAVRGEKISAIFVQKQFSTHTAETIGKNLNARVIVADPLAENYAENLESLACIIAGEKK